MKAFVCRCEDITDADCREAIDDGMTAFEDLKRFLGVGTGPCQGKACVATTMQMLADQTGVPLDDLDIMTFRPPVRPIALGTLAADLTEEE